MVRAEIEKRTGGAQYSVNMLKIPPGLKDPVVESDILRAVIFIFAPLRLCEQLI